MRRDGKFIVVVWRDLASRSKDEMNPAVEKSERAAAAVSKRQRS